MKYPKTIGPLTIYSWGADLKTPLGYFVLVWRGSRSFYLSRDATPADREGGNLRFFFGRPS